MTYKFQPRKQLIAALVACLVVIAIGQFGYGMIDWPTVIGVTLGVFLGMGVMRKEDATALENDAGAPPAEQPTSAPIRDTAPDTASEAEADDSPEDGKNDRV